MKISYWSSARKAYPSDHIGFHDPQYGLIRADPLLSERDTNFAHTLLHLHGEISGDVEGKLARDTVLISRGSFMIKGLKLNL